MVKCICRTSRFSLFTYFQTKRAIEPRIHTTQNKRFLYLANNLEALIVKYYQWLLWRLCKPYLSHMNQYNFIPLVMYYNTCKYHILDESEKYYYYCYALSLNSEKKKVLSNLSDLVKLY